VTQADRQRLTRHVLSRCESLGFALSGVAPCLPMARADAMRRWLARGEHGTMDYLQRHADAKADPASQLPGAVSVVMVADQYAPRGDTDKGQGEQAPPAGVGRVARYARGRDYHKVIKRRLHTLCDELAADHPGARFRAFVDTAPIHERELAVAAGLGWVGKHTLLIHPVRGSWLLLGGVLTTLELEPARAAVDDHCGTCTRCIDACPTDAITPYSVNASRCVSYLTIERRQPIPQPLEAGLGDWLLGCDVCQEVCPHNAPTVRGGGERREDYQPRHDWLDPADVMRWDEGDRVARLGGTPATRATLDMLRRNAVLVAANHLRSPATDDATRRRLRDALAALEADQAAPDPLRTLARRALGQDAGGA